MKKKDQKNLERAIKYASKAQHFLTQVDGDYMSSREGLGGADANLWQAIDYISNVLQGTPDD